MNYRGTDLAWAAGFIEAEGCFRISWHREGRNVGAEVNVQQVDIVPLRELREMFGGSIHYQKPRGTHSGRWSWTVTTKFCREILPLLSPHMRGCKKAEAEYLHQFAISLVPQNGVPVSAREIKRRDKARRHLQAMKLRNINAERLKNAV